MLECAVCHHPKRNEIDLALIGKRPRLHFIVDRFGLTKTSLVRHRNTCLPNNPLQAKAASDAQAISALVREIQQIANFSSKLLSHAVREQDFELAARVIEQLEVQLAVKAWCLDEPKKTPNRAEKEAGKLRVLSGRISVRDWVGKQADVDLGT
jgi:hypothetical protein